MASVPKKRILRMLAKGFNTREIARTLKVKQSSVLTIKRECGKSAKAEAKPPAAVERPAPLKLSGSYADPYYPSLTGKKFGRCPCGAKAQLHLGKCYACRVKDRL